MKLTTFWGIILGLLLLQSVHSDLRLIGKSYKNFFKGEKDFISSVEQVMTENHKLLQPHSKFYMEHKNNPDLIKNYFSAQYALVPKLVSDKVSDSSLPTLKLYETKDGDALRVTILAPE